MGLTKKERRVLELGNQGLSDYEIARRIQDHPPTVTRVHKGAYKKLAKALADIQWAKNIGLDASEYICESEENTQEGR